MTINHRATLRSSRLSSPRLWASRGTAEEVLLPTQMRFSSFFPPISPPSLCPVSRFPVVTTRPTRWCSRAVVGCVGFPFGSLEEASVLEILAPNRASSISLSSAKIWNLSCRPHHAVSAATGPTPSNPYLPVEAFCQPTSHFPRYGLGACLGG